MKAMVNLEKMANDMEKLQVAEAFNDELKKNDLNLTSKQIGVIMGCFMKVMTKINLKDKITWEITSYGDCHGAGYFEVGLTGYDADGNEYEADGEAMDNEIVEINNVVCVKEMEVVSNKVLNIIRKHIVQKLWKRFIG